MPRGTVLLIALATGYIFLWYKAMTENKTIGGAALETISAAGQLLTRGLRNNNPGNIRISGAAWVGKVSPNTDGEFEQFNEAENGIRALAKVLQSYAARGVKTIDSIIKTYAPSGENNTEAYIRSVENQTGMSRYTVLQYPRDLYALVPAIIRHENGINPYTPDTITTGIMRA